MPANGTASSPSAPKHSRQQNSNSKPPKQVKAKKESLASTTATAASQSQNAGSKDAPGAAGGKAKNKRTADVLGLFSEREMSGGGTIRLKPVGKDGSGANGRKKPRTGNPGNWKERAEELEKQGKRYLIHQKAIIRGICGVTFTLEALGARCTGDMNLYPLTTSP